MIIYSKSRVKCTLVQALRLCTGRTTHRGSRGIALLFLDHGARRGWGVSVMPQPLLTPGRDPVPIVQEAGWAPGPVWTGSEILLSQNIAVNYPDHPTHFCTNFQPSVLDIALSKHCVLSKPLSLPALSSDLISTVFTFLCFQIWPNSWLYAC